MRRWTAPGALTHVIVRFVDGQFIMDDVDGARDQYLTRLDRAMHRTDWTLCWYALMGTHVHLGLVCGEDPLHCWAKPLHSGWASWVNSAGRRRGGKCRGPVVADRPRTIYVPDHHGRHLGAYLHNNPVRAKVVESPEQCCWTSHRAYLGLDAPIPSLDVHRGLTFYNCTPGPEGRARFHEYVLERRGDPRDPELSGSTMSQARRQARQLHGSAAELATPVLTTESVASYPVHVPIEAARTVAFAGSATDFLSEIAPILDVGADGLRGPGRSRRRGGLRRVVVVAWRMLGRRSNEMSAALQIGHSAASNILRRATQHDLRAAEKLLASLGSSAAVSEIVTSVPTRPARRRGSWR